MNLNVPDDRKMAYHLFNTQARMSSVTWYLRGLENLPGNALLPLLTRHATVNQDAHRDLHPQTALFGGGNNALRDRSPL